MVTFISSSHVFKSNKWVGMWSEDEFVVIVIIVTDKEGREMVGFYDTQ